MPEKTAITPFLPYTGYHGVSFQIGTEYFNNRTCLSHLLDTLAKDSKLRSGIRIWPNCSSFLAFSDQIGSHEFSNPTCGLYGCWVRSLNSLFEAPDLFVEGPSSGFSGDSSVHVNFPKEWSYNQQKLALMMYRQGFLIPPVLTYFSGMQAAFPNKLWEIISFLSVHPMRKYSGYDKTHDLFYYYGSSVGRRIKPLGKVPNSGGIQMGVMSYVAKAPTLPEIEDVGVPTADTIEKLIEQFPKFLENNFV